jgi:hypothetical protein
LGQREIFWPLPLFDGVLIISTSPSSNCTRSASISAFRAKAAPLSLWHQRQWQQWTNSGVVIMRYRTTRHVQPPSKNVDSVFTAPFSLSVISHVVGPTNIFIAPGPISRFLSKDETVLPASSQPAGFGTIAVSLAFVAAIRVSTS